MSQKKIDWILINRLIISIEILLFWVTGLVVSSLYYAWDFSGFIYNTSNATNFWLGFTVLATMIIYSGLIIGSFLVMLLRINDVVQCKKKYATKK